MPTAVRIVFLIPDGDPAPIDARIEQILLQGVMRPPRTADEWADWHRRPPSLALPPSPQAIAYRVESIDPA